ncbi:MAG: GNAT family N-acetyltransferase [Rhizomicrobium sp.]
MNIRDLHTPEDEAAALAFIMGSQRFEHALEPDRRLDPAVAREHFAALTQKVATNQGRMFIAEEDGRAVGWVVFLVERKPVFVVEDERTHGYITELFVEDGARGLGVGRALIEACEDEARRLGLSQIMIGLLTKNARAAEIYARAGYGPYASELRKYL